MLRSTREAQRKCYRHSKEEWLLPPGVVGLGAWQLPGEGALVIALPWPPTAHCSLLQLSAQHAGLQLSVYVSVSPIRPRALRGQGACFVQIPIPRASRSPHTHKGLGKSLLNWVRKGKLLLKEQHFGFPYKEGRESFQPENRRLEISVCPCVLCPTGLWAPSARIAPLVSTFPHVPSPVSIQVGISPKWSSELIGYVLFPQTQRSRAQIQQKSAFNNCQHLTDYFCATRGKIDWSGCHHLNLDP